MGDKKMILELDSGLESEVCTYLAVQTYRNLLEERVSAEQIEVIANMLCTLARITI